MREHLPSLGRDQIVASLSRGSIGFRHQKSYHLEHERESIDSGSSEEHAETPRMEPDESSGCQACNPELKAAILLVPVAPSPLGLVFILCVTW